MKKSIGFIALFIMSLMIVGASAASTINVVAKEISVVQKTSDWNVVANGASGKVKLTFGVDSMVYNSYKYTSSILTPTPKCSLSVSDKMNNVTCEQKLALNDAKVLSAVTSQTGSVIVNGLKPVTEYTLVYYGDETNNNVWPYVTCVSSFKTSTQGYAKSMSGDINFLAFLTDNVAQKFWVVPSTDVNCDTGMMVAWNPTSYLFELATI